ncbi:MAG: hypothetical protein E6Q97_25415 [Desulfurellales bacterium]|nr:MAG: hypothetical protein E6Q97_25415 [Desulfurellales bacterium]
MATSTGLSILITAKNEASGALDAVRKSLGQLAQGARDTVNKGLDPIRNLLATGLKAAAVGATAAIGGLVGLAGKSIALAAGFEQTEVAFATMLGSADKAKDLMKDLFEFSAKTPFQFAEVSAAAKSLMAFGVSATDVKDTLRRLGDVAAGINAPVGEIAEIYGKAKVQGRLFAEDINQLTGRGIPIIQELAKVLGVTEGEVKAMVEAGKVGFPELEKAFQGMTDKGGKFAGMMEAQSQTLAGLWSSLKDNVELALAGIGKSLVENLNLKDVLAQATEWIGKFGARIQELVATWLPPLIQNIQALIQYVNFLVKSGDPLNDWLTQMSPAVADVTLKVANFIVGIKNLLQPIIDLVARFISWKDIVVAAAGIIATIAIPALYGLVAAYAPVLAVVAGAIAIVATLRNAWETNFGGIRTLVQATMDYLQMRFGGLYEAVRQFGGGALREIIGWAAGTETQFNSLGLIWEKAKATAQTLFNDLVAMVQRNLPLWISALTGWGLAAWQWVQGAATVALTKLGEWGQALGNWVVTNLPTWVAKLSAWGAALWGWVSPMIELAVTKLGEWGNALWNWLKDNLPTWLTKLGEWGTAAWQWLVAAIGPMLTKLGEWGNALWNWLKDNLPTWLTKLGEWGTAAWQWIVDAKPTVLTKLGEWGAALWGWVKDNVPKWIENFLAYETAMWQWIGDAIPQAIDKLTAWADEMLHWAGSGGEGDSKILEMFGTLATTMLTALGKIGLSLAKLAGTVALDLLIALAQGLLDWADIDINLWKIKDHMEEVFNDVVARVKDHFWGVAGDIVRSIASGLDSAKNSASDMISTVMGGVVDKFNTVKDGVKNHFFTVAKDVVWGLRDGFEAVRNDPVGKINEVLNGIGAALDTQAQGTGIKAKLATMGRDLVYNLRDGINSFANDPKTAISTLVTNLENAIDTGGTVANHFLTKGKELAGAIGRGLGQGADSVLNGIAGPINSLVNWINQMFDGGGTIFTHVYSKAKETGINMVNGMIAGLNEKFAAVRSAITWLTDNLPEWVKTALGIHSPSKVFMDIGGNIMAGLVAGIEAMKLEPQLALAGAVDPMVNAANSTTTINRNDQRSYHFALPSATNGGQDPIEAVRSLTTLYGGVR